MPVLASLAAYRDRSYPCELRVERHMGCKSGASLSSWAAFLRMSHPSGAGQRVYELRGIPIKSSAPRCPLVHHGRNSVHRVRRRLNGVTHQSALKSWSVVWCSGLIPVTPPVIASIDEHVGECSTPEFGGRGLFRVLYQTLFCRLRGLVFC
ncbi:hypothetical protein RRG08_016132 [Elysia crispata]|uniref:Uncharacterized protein n=1 Tax=Elysia crispata TaxID=231223 RepID=A0AAE1D9H7_9GAST|nr:hypothetical protein RRG08_016132 [Elysia crispata]